MVTRPLVPLLAIACIGTAGAAVDADRFADHHPHIRHVLLLSIDGCHGLDLDRFVATHPHSALAALAASGVVYSDAACPTPSDSFPGLLALVTGGTPTSTGVYYDDSYDRALFAPGTSPLATPMPPRGTEVVYDESLDRDPDALDGGGGIDPAKLPLDAHGNPVYPHQYLRDDTIFEVAHWFGLRTAWADKHPAYDLVNGPSGEGVDDLFTPEINNAASPTSSAVATAAYDDLKVAAVVDEIAGLDHSGGHHVGVPAIFGMNFQAVSVGQKLTGDGYVDAAATPSAPLEIALEHTDASIGSMVAALRAHGLEDDTVVVVTAKHGQSPIDPAKVRKVAPALIESTVAGVDAGLLAHLTADDTALIWLNDSHRADAVKAALLAQAAALSIDEVLAGDELRARFGWPDDSRRPDLLVLPKAGTIYTTSKKKMAEHGGASPDDVHVALLVSNPWLEPRVITRHVETRQVAPTILDELHLPSWLLRAVWIEHTRPLPGLEFRRWGELVHHG